MVSARRWSARVVALGLLVVGVVVAVGPVSGAQERTGPQAVGWWSRQVPLQESDRADAEVTPQAVGAPVRYTPTQNVPEVPPSVPLTTVPLPVEPPELPDPPVEVPDPGVGAPNPTVPDGGLWVGNDPSGPYAVSALRFRGDIGAGELTLVFAPGTSTVSDVVACPVISDWSPGPEGAWRDRPADDCDRFAISGSLTPDGTSMVFGIPQGFQPFGARVLDIMLLPKPGSGDLVNMYFEAPGPESFEVFAGQALPQPEPELPDPDPATLPTTIPPLAVGGTNTVGVPSTGAPTTGVAAPTPAPSVGTPGVAVPAPVANVLEAATESRAARIIAAVVLVLMGLGIFWLGGQPVRAPQLIGGLGAGAPGGAATVAASVVAHRRSDPGRGIGRFRRPRGGPPTRL